MQQKQSQQPQQSKNPEENQSQMQSSQMQSSAGFRVGAKVKISQQSMRPGSREARKTQTGEIFPNMSEIQTVTYQLSLMNIYQDELTFCSSLKFDLQNLQEQINQLDIDGKLRSTEKSDLLKNHVSQIKKWLQQHTNKNIQSIIESKMNQNIDQQKLIESLNQNNAGDALVKLFKMTQVLEMMVVKITELDAIHFLRYDDHYNQLCKVESMSSTQSQTIDKISSQGVIMNRFTLNLLNIERTMDFIQSASKMNQQILSQKVIQPQATSTDTKDLESRMKKVMNDNALLQKIIKQKEADLAKDVEAREQLVSEQSKQIQQLTAKIVQLEIELRSQIDSNFTKKDQQNNKSDDTNKVFIEQNNQLISKVKQLQTDNESLEIQVSTLKRQIEDIKVDVKPIQKLPIAIQPAINPESYIKIIDDTRKEYESKIKSLQNEIADIKGTSLEIQIKYENFKQQVYDLEKQVLELQKINDELYRKFALKYLNQEDYANSYEAAMKYEFDTMKKAFQKKTDQLTKDCDQLKRDNLKNQSQMRKELEKEQETKKLLMNKLSLYTQ